MIKEIRQAIRIVRLQQQLIDRQTQELRDWQTATLTAARNQRELLIGWILSLDQPEISCEEDLHRMLTVISDEVAKLEEQIIL
jgi:hypothetical protein